MPGGGQKEHESNFSRARPSQDMFEHGSSVLDKSRQEEKADSTLRSSQAVPHPSTDRALRRLTSEVERDPVHSTWYGRQRKYIHEKMITFARLAGLGKKIERSTLP